jgi:FtsH-binding integral membrane protein
MDNNMVRGVPIAEAYYIPQDDSSATMIFHPFEDKIQRTGFIRKVYTLLSFQLLITFTSLLLVNLSNNVKKFILSEAGVAINIVCMVGLLILTFILCCNYKILKKYPTNYIYLLLFTIFTSYSVSTITAYYSTTIVLYAILITALITIVLTIYACQTRIDYTDCGGYLLSILIGLILIGLINIFVQNKFLESIYAGLGAILFSCYIVYDTQLIVGGFHKKYQFAIDDIVLATLSIYLDIINLFLYILECLNNNE